MVILRCNVDWFALINPTKPSIDLWILSGPSPESHQIIQNFAGWKVSAVYVNQTNLNVQLSTKMAPLEPPLVHIISKENGSNANESEGFCKSVFPKLVRVVTQVKVTIMSYYLQYFAMIARNTEQHFGSVLPPEESHITRRG